MKKFLFLVLSFISNHIYTQDLQFEYEYTKIIDSMNSKTQNYILECHKNYHYFYGKNSYSIDSLTKIKEEEVPVIANLRIPNSKKKYQKDILKSFLSENGKDYFLKSNFTLLKIKYEDTIKLNWNLEENTMEYLGYTCNQATAEYAGRKYIAWYTKEIPINAGPYVFKGLPGLIVKIYDSENKHAFRLVEIKKSLNHFSTAEYQLVSKKKAKELQMNVENNPLKMLLPDFQLTEESQRRLEAIRKNNNKKDLNPIELVD